MNLDIVLYTEGPEFNGDALETGPLGGSETAFISLSCALAAAGHRVTAYCRCPRPAVYSGVRFRDVSDFEQWRSCGPSVDLFVCSRWFPVLYRPSPARVTVFWNHDPFGEEFREALRPAIANISYTYCLSDFQRDTFAIVAQVPTNTIRKTFNGVDFALIDPIRQAAVEHHRIMYISRPERGLMRALDIYERLDDPTLEFVAATYPYAGNERDQEIERRCSARIAALRAAGLPIETGQFTKTELYHRLAESKLVLYPSEVSEVFCIAAIEAQACGTVFLATSTFGLSETATYPGLALVDADGFVREASRVLTDDGHRRAAEEIGLRHARRFTWEAVASQFVADAHQHIASGLDNDRRGVAPRPVAANPAAATTSRPTDRSAFSRRGPLPADPGQARLVRIQERAAAASRARPAASGDARISCLMVTLGRLRQMKRAITCYVDQTYTNRELLIVTDGAADFCRAAEVHLAGLGRDDIRLVVVNGTNRTLGSLRNIALARATGDRFCQWDDDDLYHPDRLAVQAQYLDAENAHACFLADQLQFHWPKRRMRWVDWSRDGTFALINRIIPGTIMATLDDQFAYPEDGPQARHGEDSAYLNALANRVPVTTLSGAGHLYVYSYHGRNTFPEEHHRAHNGASAAFLRDRLAMAHASALYYPVPRPFTFVGSGGETLFVVNNEATARPPRWQDLTPGTRHEGSISLSD